MWNLIIGILLILAALSGRFVMIGTGRSWPLTAIGVGLVIWGLAQIIRKNRQ